MLAFHLLLRRSGYYAPMGKLHHIRGGKPRKLHEVEWTDSGLRLSPVRRVVQSDWFWPAMLTVPLGAFLIVFFW